MGKGRSLVIENDKLRIDRFFNQEAISELSVVLRSLITTSSIDIKTIAG
jgi:hypothetical protein